MHILAIMDFKITVHIHRFHGLDIVCTRHGRSAFMDSFELSSLQLYDSSHLLLYIQCPRPYLLPTLRSA